MPSYVRTVKMAAHALRRNVLRSVLTTLGIVIGIAAVIAMMEIGQGSARAIEQTIQRMGADNFIVQPGTASSGGVSFGSGSVTTLTPQDGEAILRECPAVRQVAPIVRTRTQVIYGNKNWVPAFIYGTTPEFLEVRDWDLEAGEMFTERDVRNQSKVCIIGLTIVNELFPGESPLGKELRMQSVSLRIVGVLSTKGANMMGLDQDDIILAPWTTIKYRISGTTLANANQSEKAKTDTSQQVNTLNKLYPTDLVKLYPDLSPNQLANYPQPVRFTNVDQILVRARTPDEVDTAIRQATAVVREKHKIKPGQPDDFNTRNMAETAKTMSETTTLMTRLLLFVALIALVVGGVGIMTVQLISVTERTREIGLRMAVGARGGDILRQFLVEALLLCLIGGIIGIGVGRGVSYLMRVFMHFPTMLSIPAILASVGVSASVGLVFGFYPAWKASRLDPIQALRYE